jgi:hypothetical protein
MLQDMVWAMFGYEKEAWASCESICKVFFNSITAAARRCQGQPEEHP